MCPQTLSVSLVLHDALTNGSLVGSSDLVNLLVSLEELEGGHGLDTGGLGSFAICIDIDLHELDIFELISHGLELGSGQTRTEAP